jgi:hypothetical protein
MVNQSKSQGQSKPAKLGNVWVARAKLLDGSGNVIGHCMDTPNAIARALMDHDQAQTVESFCEGRRTRADYASRMQPWNTCPDTFQPVENSP